MTRTRVRLKPGIFLCVALLQGCATTAITPPDWFQHRSYGNDATWIYGYGRGASTEEARAHAAADIAQSLGSRIKSETESSSVVQTDGVKETTNSKQSVRVSLQANAVLHRTEVLRSEEMGGNVFIALKYDTRPLALRLAVACTGMVAGNKHGGYLGSTPAAAAAQDAACPPDWQLRHHDGNWAMQLGNKSVPLAEAELATSFFTNSGDWLSLTPTDKIRNGAYYFLTLRSPREGYLSIFVVDQSGRAVRAMSNKQVKAGARIEFPNRSEFEGLQAILGEPRSSSQDLVLALLCPEENQVAIPALAEDNAGATTTNFHLLLNASKSCLVASRVLWIDP